MGIHHHHGKHNEAYVYVHYHVHSGYPDEDHRLAVVDSEGGFLTVELNNDPCDGKDCSWYAWNNSLDVTRAMAAKEERR